MNKPSKLLDSDDFADFENFFFSQKSTNIDMNLTENYEAINDQRELSLINLLSALIELKRENGFLKNLVKNLEKILNKNLVDKFTKNNNIDINLWMLAEKDKKIKEKLSILRLENNITNNNNNNKNNQKKKKKKAPIEDKNNEESSQTDLNTKNNFNNKNENISADSFANPKVKSNKFKEAKNDKKNMKMDIEDFSLNSNYDNNDFKFERINKTGFDRNKNSFNFFTNKFTSEPGQDIKIKSNIKKVTK